MLPYSNDRRIGPGGSAGSTESVKREDSGAAAIAPERVYCPFELFGEEAFFSFSIRCVAVGAGRADDLVVVIESDDFAVADDAGKRASHESSMSTASVKNELGFVERESMESLPMTVCSFLQQIEARGCESEPGIVAGKRGKSALVVRV